MEQIDLLWEEIQKDEDGFPVTQQHGYAAYGEKKSATRMEVYEAMRAGVEVKAVFEVRLEDWEETKHLNNGRTEYARKIVYDGEEYEIVRAYEVGKSKVEVTCG